MTGTLAIKKISGSAAKLKKFSEPLRRILAFSPAEDMLAPKKSLCISIDKAGFSLAYGARFFSKIKLLGFKRYAAEDGRYPQPDSLASSVALALSEFGTAKADITLSLPKEWAVIRTAEYPLAFKENLSEAVSYEMDRLTPFEPEDVFYDFRILKEDNAKINLLVVAVKNELINPYVAALREAGFNVSRATVNLSGIGTLCHYMNSPADSVFVEINENGFEGASFSDNSITGVFSGEFAARDGKSKADMIMAEIDPLLEGFRKLGRTPGIAVLSKDRNPAIKELLKLRMNLPVMMLDETVMKFIQGQEENISCAGAGGVLEALWPRAMGLNLLQKGHREMSKTPKAFTLALVFAIIAMGALYMLSPLWVEDARLKETDRQIMLRKEEVRKVEALKKEMDVLKGEIASINSFKEDKPIVLDMIRELTAILPATGWLTRAKITESAVEFQGYAKSASELLPKLEASKYFKKAEFVSPTYRDVRSNSDVFNISVKIEGLKKDEAEGLKSEKK